MAISRVLKAASLDAWRGWLKAHHATQRVIWLVFPKQESFPSVTYGDARDEALCWGWIDSLIKRIDDASFARKFTPRTNAEKWSTVNVNRLKALLAAGRVQPSGLAVIAPKVMDRVHRRSVEPAPARPRAAAPCPPELEWALSKNDKARAFFEKLAPSYRRFYIGWTLHAKRAETRKRRSREAVKLLAKGVKVFLK